MSDEIVYRFTPYEAGAYLRGVPMRDLTEADVAALTPDLRRDALAPHPVHGTPLYTAVESRAEKRQERIIAAAERAAERDGAA